MTPHDTPFLEAALTQIYDKIFEIFDHDDDFTFKKETSATKAFLLLSRYYRSTGNIYFLEKIEEIYHSVNSSVGKWRNDLWQPGLVEFAYSLHELTNPAKVVKEVLIKWSKQNMGCPVGVNVFSISALKEVLLSTRKHVNHESAYEFIVKSCAHIPPSFIMNPDPDFLVTIIEEVLSSMHHHITSSNQDDPLHEANNFFILCHLGLCQKQIMADFMTLHRDLDRVERSESDCDFIIQAMICDSERLPLILRELGYPNRNTAMDYRSIRRAEMSIISKFTSICRSKFLAKFPTTCLFDDIFEELLSSFGVRTEDLSEIAGMLGIDGAALEAASHKARCDELDWSENNDHGEERELSDEEGEDGDESMEDMADTDLESCDEDHAGMDSCDVDQYGLVEDDEERELEGQAEAVFEGGRGQHAEMSAEEADVEAVQLDTEMSHFQDDIDGSMDSR